MDVYGGMFSGCRGDTTHTSANTVEKDFKRCENSRKKTKQNGFKEQIFRKYVCHLFICFFQNKTKNKKLFSSLFVSKTKIKKNESRLFPVYVTKPGLKPGLEPGLEPGLSVGTDPEVHLHRLLGDQD
ncbi:hypothetical protein NL108_018664 [Boleophthalmus pectinirostris]|nr:hypothetical protein NL108_018664 [Boleophthalmus pectinirostris]